MYIIGVDLGGTRIRAARFGSDLSMLQREETLTLADEGPDAIIERIIALIREVWPQDGGAVQGIGISSPGPLDPVTGVVVAPTNLPGWRNVPLGQQVQETFGVQTYVGNDANVAVLAEAALGAARGCQHAIFITVSTGLGSGILVDGRLLLGDAGLAAEVGSIMMPVDDGYEYLEYLVAGLGLAKQIRKRIEAGAESSLVARVDGDLSKITASMIGEAAQQGDALALEIIQRAGFLLGLGMTTLLHLFNPEILIIGGGVTQIGDLLMGPMHQTMRESVIYESYYSDLRIEAPQLGEDVSLIGAAALVQTDGGLLRLSEL